MRDAGPQEEHCRPSTPRERPVPPIPLGRRVLDFSGFAPPAREFDSILAFLGLQISGFALEKKSGQIVEG